MDFIVKKTTRSIQEVEQYRLHLKSTDAGYFRHFIPAPANEHDIRYTESLPTDDRGGWQLGCRSKTLQQTPWDDRKEFCQLLQVRRCGNLRRLI